MRGAGHTNHTQNHTAREAFEEHVRGLRDISAEEMAATFRLDDVLTINDYQIAATDMGRLALKPLPDEISEKYGSRTDMLVDNTTSYDEDGEDLLFEDQVILGIVDARRSQDNAEMTALFRVRRSVVAFILFHWKSIEEEQRLRETA